MDADPGSSERGIDGRAVGRPGLPALPLILLVRLYQVTLGLAMGGHCRFHPTCSHYAIEALTVHGALKGSWLTIRRLSRCHPFSTGGYDPVPPKGLGGVIRTDSEPHGQARRD